MSRSNCVDYTAEQCVYPCWPIDCYRFRSIATESADVFVETDVAQALSVCAARGIAVAVNKDKLSGIHRKFVLGVGSSRRPVSEFRGTCVAVVGNMRRLGRSQRIDHEMHSFG